jgi:aspartate kinase
MKRISLFAGLKVCKFGGTSLATADQIRKVCEIILSDPERRIIVLSAPGKRHPHDMKVTDLLIECTEAKLCDKNMELQSAIELVVERFSEIMIELGIESEIEELAVEQRLLERLNKCSRPEARFIDGVKALGEELCTRLVTAYLISKDIEASFVDPKEIGLLLSDEAGNAQVLTQTYKNLSVLRERSGLQLVPGFYGYTTAGDLVTFPRGGSDITGAVVAAAVNADIYENFTDVEGVMAVDPRIVENPKLVTELTYSEMRELSYSGFDVIQAEALKPVFWDGIPVRIANTNNPTASGTRIVLKREATPTQPVVGIAASTGFCSIFISKYLMNREIGFGSHLLKILENLGLSYEHSPSSVDTLSVILREAEFNSKEQEAIALIKADLGPNTVRVDRGLALIMVVGENMRHTIGLSSRATGALARAGINIEMMNQGSSEISMMFGIRSQQMQTAVKALYQEFFQS